MKQATETYVCDRCGERTEFDVEKTLNDKMLEHLGKDGWRIIKIGWIGKPGTYISKHLCSGCVKGLAEHLDKQTPLP